MINRNELSRLHTPTVWLPHSIEDAVEHKRRFGSAARFISGGTLLQIQWESGHRLPDQLISLELIPLLKAVHYQENEGSLVIGALTPLAQLYKHPLINHIHPKIGEAARFIASPAVRTRGTIGGNIMGGIGDLIPLLLALKAKLLFISPTGEERIDTWEWIKQAERYKHALLAQIIFPTMSEAINEHLFFRKIGRRESFTAAIVTVSGRFKKTDLDTVADVRLAAGGGDNKPHLLERTKELLRGKRTEEIDWKAVYRSICDEFLPVTDAFVTADYRKKVAANLIITELKSRLYSNDFA